MLTQVTSNLQQEQEVGERILFINVVCFQVGSPQIPKDPEKLPANATALPPVESPPPPPTPEQAINGNALCSSIGFLMDLLTL